MFKRVLISKISGVSSELPRSWAVQRGVPHRAVCCTAQMPAEGPPRVVLLGRYEMQDVSFHEFVELLAEQNNIRPTVAVVDLCPFSQGVLRQLGIRGVKPEGTPTCELVCNMTKKELPDWRPLAWAAGGLVLGATNGIEWVSPCSQSDVISYCFY